MVCRWIRYAEVIWASTTVAAAANPYPAIRHQQSRAVIVSRRRHRGELGELHRHRIPHLRRHNGFIIGERMRHTLSTDYEHLASRQHHRIRIGPSKMHW